MWPTHRPARMTQQRRTTIMVKTTRRRKMQLRRLGRRRALAKQQQQRQLRKRRRRRRQSETRPKTELGPADGARRAWPRDARLGAATTTPRFDRPPRASAISASAAACGRRRATHAAALPLGPGCSRKGDEGSPVTQVHRRATRLRTASSGGASLLAATLSGRSGRASFADKTRASPSPKARCTFSIDCRRPRRAYLVAKENRLIIGPSSNSNAKKRAGLSTNAVGNAATNSKTDQLLHRIKTELSRQPSRGPQAARLRPPVRRLRAMPQPASSGLGSARSNNRSPVVRRGVGWLNSRSADFEEGLVLAREVAVDVPHQMTSSAGHIRDAYGQERRHFGDRLDRHCGAANMAPVTYGGLAESARCQLQRRKQQPFNEMDQIKASSRPLQWHWSQTKKSHECIVNEDRLSLCFHPHCSESAAACRADKPLKRNGNYYYWEIHVHDKIYGTSVMFGLCTSRQRMHAHDYCNLVGLDDCGWSLSHKGLAWHNGVCVKYTNPFPSNQPITVGLLFNTVRGELSFFMDGKNLGVAFRGLNDFSEELYPVVASTAKCTLMTLSGSYCGYVSLLERSCFTLLKSVAVKDRRKFIEQLREQHLPRNLLLYVASAANVHPDAEADNNNNNSHSTNTTTETLSEVAPQQPDTDSGPVQM